MQLKDIEARNSEALEFIDKDKDSLGLSQILTLIVKDLN